MTDTSDQLRAHYDAVPYPGAAFWPTHPDNLRTIAALAGITAPPVAQCRVLEIGCSIGRNLLPMAQTLPGSRFLGVDLSPLQIRTGVELVGRLGLSNVELRCQDLMNLGADEGPFDYVIAHGVYSWVPEPVRQRILHICARQMSPTGLAYLSYNALPGWRLNQSIRDMAMFHSGEEPDPVRRVAKAREMIAFAAQNSPGWGPYKNLVTAVNGSWAEAKDFYLAHEYMAPVNNAYYFSEFVRQITEQGLSYVGDANPALDITHLLSPAQQQQLASFGTDEVRRQLYLDFLEGRTFRASIVCRADAPRVSTGGPPPPALYVSGRMTEEAGQDPTSGAAVTRFGSTAANFKMTLNDPGMIAAFRHLRATWPHAVRLADLADIAAAHGAASGATRAAVANEVAQAILISYKSKILELHTRPTDFLATTLQRPRVTLLARLQAAEGEPLINLRHHQMPINDTVSALLPLLDGTRTRDELLAEFTRRIASGELKLSLPSGPLTAANDLGAMLDEILRELSDNCLLAS